MHVLRIALLGVALMVAAAAAAADTHGEAHLPGLYLDMLRDYRRYAEAFWHAAQPGQGYWGSGRAQAGDEGVRAQANNALVYALLESEGDTPSVLQDRVAPALRYTASIHVTGTAKGTDGKTWGRSWQSAMNAGTLGMAAWLVRDRLDAPTLQAVERVVGDEADRFIGADPPDRAPGDTKAEENAWDLTAPAAALLLMPRHPHAAGWREAVIRYGLNTLSVPADRLSERMVDGRPLRERVTTTQLNADFTLENHGFFHPTYMMVAPALMGAAAVDLKLGGQAVPEALSHNVRQQARTLRRFALADGEWLYGQGLDWDLHSYEQVQYWALMATRFRDRAAALMEQRAAAALRRRQLMNGDGRFVGAMSPIGFVREEAQAERVAWAYLMHRAFGPAPSCTQADWDRAERVMGPVRAFRDVGLVVHRLPRGVFSFSWKNHLMGLAEPQSGARTDSPYVTTPRRGSLVGTFVLEGQAPGAAQRFTAKRAAVVTSPGGFAAALEADVNDGRLRQQMAVASAAPGVLAYVDRVVSLTGVSVAEACGVPIAVENDDVTGGRRQIVTERGSWTATGGQEGDHALPGRWANVDGRLGLVSVLGDGLLYRSAGKPNRPGAREDLLMGSYQRGPRPYPAGAVVAERAGLILPGSSAAETAAAAASAEVRRDGGTLVIAFTAQDGRKHSLALLDDGSARWDGRPVRPRTQSPMRPSAGR